MKVIGIDIADDVALEEEVRVLKIIEALQKALGIAQLTALRSELINRAATGSAA